LIFSETTNDAVLREKMIKILSAKHQTPNPLQSSSLGEPCLRVPWNRRALSTTTTTTSALATAQPQLLRPRPQPEPWRSLPRHGLLPLRRVRWPPEARTSRCHCCSCCCCPWHGSSVVKRRRYNDNGTCKKFWNTFYGIHVCMCFVSRR